MTAIERAVKASKSQTSLAKKVGVSQSHVWNWINRNKCVPAKFIRSVSLATGGKVSVTDLLKDHEDKNQKYTDIETLV